jgi:hypothetical protein
MRARDWLAHQCLPVLRSRHSTSRQTRRVSLLKTQPCRFCIDVDVGLGGVIREDRGDRVFVRERTNRAGVELLTGNFRRARADAQDLTALLDAQALGHRQQITLTPEQSWRLDDEVPHAAARRIDQHPFDVAEGVVVAAAQLEIGERAGRALDPFGVQIAKVFVAHGARSSNPGARRRERKGSIGRAYNPQEERQP